jgi:hypothetical protein
MNDSVSLRRVFAAAIWLLGVGMVPSHATTVSYTGTFLQDDDVRSFAFSVSAPGTVIVQTFGYAGGTNGAGSLIAAGGFDPTVSLFDSTGALLLYQDDDTPECNVVAADPVTGECFDVYLTTTLAAGSYLAVITQFDNHANGPSLSDGFTQDGAGNFTAAFGCEPGIFCDVDADARTGAFALDITTPNAVVPVPAAGWLFAGGLAALSGLRKIGRRT